MDPIKDPQYPPDTYEVERQKRNAVHDGIHVPLYCQMQNSVNGVIAWQWPTHTVPEVSAM